MSEGFVQPSIMVHGYSEDSVPGANDDPSGHVSRKDAEVTFEWHHVITRVLRNQPREGGTAPGALDSARKLKMPSMARRPLFIST